MPNHSLSLPFWEGFAVTSFTEQGQSVTIRLEPCPSAPRICGHCASAAPKVHDVCWRTAGQRIIWLDSYSRVTRRLAAFVALWSERMPISHVCQLTGLYWSTVRHIHQLALQRKLAARPEAQPTRLVMDEFALFKGRRYATVVLDADSRQVLWVGEGRSREAVCPFFEWLGPERCARIEAVAMDMNTAFDLEVRQHCLQARVVYDLSHVIAKYGREVIDRVRVDEANRLREDRPQPPTRS